MKILFMGTPEFARGALQAILDAGHEVVCVVTQPDRPSGRGRAVKYTPVKELAVEHGIKVLQPEKIKQDTEVLQTLKDYAPDIIVVVAYGQIIQKEILDLPKYGCVNVHASLLPKLRGASPIQHAILQGEEETGVTIMQMDVGLDTGDMLSKASLVIGDRNCQQLHDDLAELGAKLLVETLPRIEAGNISPEKQDDSLSSYAGMISKQDGKIDFHKSPIEIQQQIRAFDPWPGAFCNYGDVVMKIWSAEPVAEKTSKAPGTIICVSDNGVDTACGDGQVLRITEIQMPGKKRVSVKDYLRGNKIEIDSLFE